MKKSNSALKIILLILLAAAILFLGLFLSNKERAENADQTPVEDDDGALTDSIKINGNEVTYEYTIADENTPAMQAEGNPVMESNQTSYKNGVISCQIRTGGTFSLGVDSTKYNGKIILNPVYTPKSDELIPWLDITQFAFYIKADCGQIIKSSTVEGPYNSPENAERQSLYINNRLYDTCIPADYRSEEDYGIAWNDPEMNLGSSPKDTVNFSIRIVRIFDGELMDILKATAVYDYSAEEYRFDKLYSADVSGTKELSDATRSKLVQMAKEFMISDEKGQHIGFAVDDWDYACDNAIVEHSGSVYFPRLLSWEGEVIAAGKYFNCDVYAVNIPYSGIGYMTVYLAPTLQMRGFNTTIPEDKTDVEFSVLGYDPLFPQSRESIGVPDYLAEEFFGHM